MAESHAEAVLNEQIAYYRARAPEYDQWWLRQGRYDLGEDFRRQWVEEIREVTAALEEFAVTGDVLELAAGTGIWTVELARSASRITAIDASIEALQICRSKLEGTMIPAEFVQADLFAWRPDRRHDVVFFSFWLTHVPTTHFERFWELVDESLAPGGRFFLIDSAPPVEEMERQFPGGDVDARTYETDSDHERTVRRLSDGRSFQIVKKHRSPSDLANRLVRLGWDAEIRKTKHFFIYGSGARRRGRAA
jgi:ubiquinone/menaquinone biosynthesis C-methylase UbiE